MEVEKKAEEILKKSDLSGKYEELKVIEKEATNPDFWKDTQAATKKMQRMGTLQKEIEELENLKKLLDQKDEKQLEKLTERLESKLYLSGKYDSKNAILTVQAGQGGVDAMDFASMLFRMYTRYLESKDYKYEIVEYNPGEEAGLKSATLIVEGDHPYGYLKGEQGVHRLVRLSPFSSAGLRHTSFARVEVVPQMEEDNTIELKDDDLEWDFYRASSHGGQNVQKVSSAVRLTHKPSGIVVTCQTERHQAQNREYALKMLKSRLWAKKEEEQKEKEAKIRGKYRAPSWGNAIRSYVLHPYQLVKDTRTGVEVGNVEKILDGDIEEFIQAELKISE